MERKTAYGNIMTRAEYWKLKPISKMVWKMVFLNLSIPMAKSPFRLFIKTETKKENGLNFIPMEIKKLPPCTKKEKETDHGKNIIPMDNSLLTAPTKTI